MLLGHLGFVDGAAPQYRDDTDCGEDTVVRSSRLALGFELPLTGYGLADELGYLATGFAIEGIWKLTSAFDAMTRADVLWFPGDQHDRVIHQAVLAGVRIDHSPRTGHSWNTGFFSTVLAGYSLGALLTPTTTGSGPIMDVSFAWGAQASELAGYMRLHGRFGISPDNVDYRAVFLSLGFEMRFDPRRWRDRL
jgi:hypothetical protein